MGTGRLEAFSDGVLAIIITIMVLGLSPPTGAELADLRAMAPQFLTYVLSFVYVGIYWNNHHHLLRAAPRINGRIMWANLHLLFWLSLFPFATAWMGGHSFRPVPTAAYGAVALMSAVAYYLLQRAIVSEAGPGSPLAASIRGDTKGKVSTAVYLVCIPLALVGRWVAVAGYVAVAAAWLVPDRRVGAL